MSQPEHPVRTRLAVVGSVVGLIGVISAPAWWRAAHQPPHVSYLGSLVSAAAARTSSGSGGGTGSGSAGPGPAGSASAGSGPAGSASAGSGPAGSASAGSGPAGSASAGSGPAGSASAGSGPAGSSAVAGPAEPLCGTGFPVPVYPPAGYRGPLPGPARGAPAPDLPGQLVAHWTGPAGDVEVRWPADARTAHDTTPVDPREEPLSVSDPGPGGFPVSGSLLLKGEKPGCRAMLLTIYRALPPGLAERLGADASGNPRFDALNSLITDPASPLVLPGVTHVAAAPAHLLACTGAPAPRQSGRVVGGAATDDPRTALRAFLEPAGHATPPVRAGRGYLELIEASGRITFAKPFAGPGKSYVAVVRMARRGGGWVVDRWEVTGC